MALHFIILHFGLVIGFFLSALVVTQVLRQRRSPTATIAWLLVIILIPYFGVPLYLMLGRRKIRTRPVQNTQLSGCGAGEGEAPVFGPTDRFLQSYGLFPATKGNRFRLCSSGEQTYRSLVGLIDQAAQSINISTFLFHEDDVGRDIMERLVSCAERGVNIRLLVDGVGSFYTSRRFLKRLDLAGGRTAIFQPMIHVPFRGQSNLRNHRKIMVVDENIVLAGGTNIGREYIGPAPIPGRWRDISFVLEGPAVGYYSRIFRSDWEYATGEKVEGSALMSGIANVNEGGDVVQVVPSGPDVRGDPLHDAILSAIFSAQMRIWIVTPYFAPDEAMVQALSMAAHRGLQVRLIVPLKSNHLLADLARGTALRQIREAGGEILLYTPGMVHAKALLIDDSLAAVGSANLDMRSLFLDHEVMLFNYSSSGIKAVEEWIMALAADTEPYTKKVGALRDMGEGIVHILAPLL
jgi:cardiolipin synthase